MKLQCFYLLIFRNSVTTTMFVDLPIEFSYAAKLLRHKVDCNGFNIVSYHIVMLKKF